MCQFLILGVCVWVFMCVCSCTRNSNSTSFKDMAQYFPDPGSSIQHFSWFLELDIQGVFYKGRATDLEGSFLHSVPLSASCFLFPRVPTLLLLFSFFFLQLFIWKAELERGRDREKEIFYLLVYSSKHLYLDQTKARSLELHLSLLAGWHGTKYLGHVLLLSPTHCRELNWK